MNGTSVMTALACIAYKRAEYLSAAPTKITAGIGRYARQWLPPQN